MTLLKGDKPVATTPRSTFVFNLAPQELEAAQRLRWVIRDRAEPVTSPAMSAIPPKAEVNPEH